MRRLLPLLTLTVCAGCTLMTDFARDLPDIPDVYVEPTCQSACGEVVKCLEDEPGIGCPLNGIQTQRFFQGYCMERCRLYDSVPGAECKANLDEIWSEDYAGVWGWCEGDADLCSVLCTEKQLGFPYLTTELGLAIDCEAFCQNLPADLVNCIGAEYHDAVQDPEADDSIEGRHLQNCLGDYVETCRAAGSCEG